MSTSSTAAAPSRGAVALALLVAAAAHVPVTREHLVEAPYMGVAFVLFTAAATALAVVVVVGAYGALALRAVMLLCAAAVAAYVATRLVAFPQLADDVGNWGETLGLVSVVSESFALVLAGILGGWRTPMSPEAWPVSGSRTSLSSTTSAV